MWEHQRKPWTFNSGGEGSGMYITYDGGDNWKKIGETSGLPTHKSSSMKWHSNAELKTLFVKPTGVNKKIIFIKTL